MARATLKTIAEITGLSITTVSRALKNGPEVKPVTINTVKEVADRVGYRPNTSGVSLKTGQTFDIALIVPVIRPGDIIGDVGTLSLIEGLTAELKGTNYHLTVIPQNPDEDDITPVKYVVEKGLSDGIILTSTRANDERVKYLNEIDFPFVTFGRTELATQHPWYDVDNADFAYRATSLLIKKGRKNITMITPDLSYLFSWHRVVGFKRAAMEHGLVLDENTNLLIEGTADEHKILIEAAQRRSPSPDAYICGTEIVALGVSSHLQKMGINIGKDVDVVTMESTRIAELFHPPITAFTQDLHKAGRQLTRLILKAIQGEPKTSLQILDTVELNERN